MSHDNDCMVWEHHPAGEDGWHDCTCKVFNPTHDPLCPNAKGCLHDCGGCSCNLDAFCLCDLIAKVRADERNRVHVTKP